jgi:excisionase family DNA binding protein
MLTTDPLTAELRDKPPAAPKARSEAADRPMLVSIERAAGLLGIHSRTVYRMLADKELPYVKLGRRTLLSVTSLDRWIADHEVPAQTGDTA